MLDQEAGINHFSKIDARFQIELGGGVIRRPTRMNRREIMEPLRITAHDPYDPRPERTDIFNDSDIDLEGRNTFIRSTDLLISAKASELTDGHLVLLTPRMYGYALQDRKWHALNIEATKDLESTPSGSKTLRTAFDDLVLPQEHKDLLQALVKNQTRRFQTDTKYPNENITRTAFKDMSIDLVRGKGRGLIILLHGVPGVGKTSTAECVAAQLKRPLFPITCGDLGVDASTVEGRLEEYFKLAQRWGCVLLLDEADVFLAKRSPDQLKRNGLVSGEVSLSNTIGLPVDSQTLTYAVSVFLRVLEYYAGVLILTTNRVGEFDEAFRSRIHVSLYYPKLEEHTTTEIWEMNIRRIKDASDIPMDVDEEGIRAFYEGHWKDTEKHQSRRWNGRQIKNAFQTAIALANWEFFEGDGKAKKLQRPHLRARHFRHVAKTSDHFDDYLLQMHLDEGVEREGNVYAFIAKRDNLRDDNLPGIAYESSTRRRQSTTPRRRQSVEVKNTNETPKMKRLRLQLELAEMEAEEERKAERTKGRRDDTDDEGGIFG